MSLTPAARKLYWTGWGVVVGLCFAGLILLGRGPEPWTPLILLIVALALARLVIWRVHGQVAGMMRWLRHGWPMAFGPIILAGGIVATGQGFAWWLAAFAPILAFRWSL